MEQQGSKAGAEQCDGYGKTAGRSLAACVYKVAVYQNRHQNGCTEHGKHVLNTQWKQQFLKGTFFFHLNEFSDFSIAKNPPYPFLCSFNLSYCTRFSCR